MGKPVQDGIVRLAEEEGVRGKSLGLAAKCVLLNMAIDGVSAGVT